jgi:hypothetical protein
MCIAFPFVFGTFIGAIFIAIGSTASYQWQRALVMMFQYFSVLPFLIPAFQDLEDFRYSRKSTVTNIQR